MNNLSSALIALWRIGIISSIEIDYRRGQNSLEGTYVKLKGSLGNIDGLWEVYQEYVDLGVNKQSVAKIKNRYAKELEDWYLLTEAKKKDLAEYNRLKEIFENTKTE